MDTDALIRSLRDLKRNLRLRGMDLRDPQTNGGVSDKDGAAMLEGFALAVDDIIEIATHPQWNAQERAALRRAAVLDRPAPPHWSTVDAPGVCGRGHTERQPKCPACHDMRIAVAESRPAPPPEERFDLEAHLKRQRDFSYHTFGPGSRTRGIIAHILKELREIEAQPDDVTEWIDVVLLALDGAWRTGMTPRGIVAALSAKQTKNEARTWPDWRTMSFDQPIEHVAASRPAPEPDPRPEDR